VLGLVPSSTRSARLVLTGVQVRFGGTVAVEDLSMSLGPGEVVGLIGPNGAGKTSVLNAVTGDVRCSRGNVELGQTQLSGRSPEQIVQLGVARTFQTPQFVPNLNLIENAMMASDGTSRVGMLGQVIGTSRARDAEQNGRDEASRLLRDFRIDHQAGSHAREQTYGTLRIAELVRNLMLNPAFLLLDEPGAGLTEMERGELAAHIGEVKARGIGVLIVDHNMALIHATCSRVYVLDHGTLIAEGAPSEVLAHRDVISAYLGSAS
jgi:branched-chain amino acid transport system permease protein